MKSLFEHKNVHTFGGKLSMDPRHYSLNIHWLDEDQIYLVTVPDLPGCKAHGQTYDEAIQNVLEVIDLWLEAAQRTGRTIPPPSSVA